MGTGLRVLAIVGVAAAVVAVAYLMRPAELPACESAEAQALLKSIALRGSSNPLTLPNRGPNFGISFAETTQVSFDNDKQERKCRTRLTITVSGEQLKEPMWVGYTITWSDRDKGEFELYAKAES